MKKQKISQIIGNIDEKFISEANSYKAKSSRKYGFVKWVAAAACLAVAVGIGITVLPKQEPQTYINYIGGVGRNYNSELSVQEASYDIEWRWEEKTLNERFYKITFNGIIFNSKAKTVSESLVGEALGSCLGEGHDFYNDKIYTENFEVHKINGISESKIVAIKMDGKFYVYSSNTLEKPETFGEVMDLYGLPQHLRFSRFSVKENGKDEKYYIVNDDEYIWQILSECRQAEVVANSDSWRENERNYISFTATSEALGVYKNVFYVTEDGYIQTNIFSYAYTYFIGEEPAAKIISYAMENSTEAEFEPYAYGLTGTVAEIGEDYILIDDSLLCVDPNEGMVFKVPTDDIKVKRCVNHFKLEVGDLIHVQFLDEIDVENGNLVTGITDLTTAIISDGKDIWILE